MSVEIVWWNSRKIIAIYKKYTSILIQEGWQVFEKVFWIYPMYEMWICYIKLNFINILASDINQA